MKKKLISIAACALLAAALPATCFAAEAPAAQTVEASAPQTTTQVEYFEDGSSLTTTLTVYDQPQTRSVYTKAATKTQTYEVSGREVWTFTLKASFSYDKVSKSAAVTSSYSRTISDSSWSMSGASATKSGNTATAKATFSNSSKNVKASVTLKCDPMGNIT